MRHRGLEANGCLRLVEKVLAPYRLLENRELLLRTGFRHVDVVFKWYDFCGMAAVK